MFALDLLRVALHTQPRCQLALMFCCIVSPGCGPMKLSYFCAGPFTPVVNATIALTRAAALQAAANSLDGIIDTVAVKHPLADYLNLLKVCCSPLYEQHLQALPLACQPHGSVQQHVWAIHTPSPHR